ncbi:Beta-galactosidase bgaB [Streptomyces sp. YIM 130001]|uniref:beta-galactosidase n=1 Tax=Streptomyces sp. YIM 130001 TaxID=2259644 RepID=UPI000EEF0299|nr:beta-galactosidase [Streptomyces sp. YIM 130001]RII17224.1 Beta-galactosidase bgaB [Streptomyces sp. YIM 130001]
MNDTHRIGRFYDSLDSVAYGGDYNPEQWGPEVHAEDTELMRKAGVNLATVGIFSWAKAEPAPGAYDFGWLDTHLDRLADAGVRVCLATMTASPPAWLARLHPETLPVMEDGTRLYPGSRQHWCPSSPVFRDHATRLVEQLAGRYADHPALALWHIGNEYGCHISRHCHCEVSTAAFRAWLRERYGTVDALNEAWCTDFWAQRYGDFDEIHTPRSAPSFRNPAQQLDYRRFSSDELLACYLAEKQVLERLTPAVPVTTNFVPVARTLDLFRWAPHLDVVSYDSYPDPHDADSAHGTAFSYDVMRGLKGGQPWLLMEQAPSAVNWRRRNGRKPDGRMRLDSWQAVAHGADSVLFFQWRQSRGGAEKFHSAMVPHGGPDTRIFREVGALGAELAALPELFGSRPERADAALLLEWPSWWALELDAHPSSDVTLLDTALAHHRPLYDASVACDIVPADGDFSPYRLLVVPNLYSVSSATAERITDYVAAGGTLVMSYFSGITDEYDRVHLGGYPAPFRELLGLRIEEFDPLPEGVTLPLGDAGTGSLWSEDIVLEGAEPILALGDGRPAVTRHTYGDGTAWYLGTRPDPATLRTLMDRIRTEASVAPTEADLPEGVQVRTRITTDGRRLRIGLDWRDGSVSVTEQE